LNQILKRQTSRFHYGSKVPAVTITITSHLNSKGTTKWDVKNKGPGLGQGQNVVVLNQLISPTPLGNLIFNENADITKISD
jgi:hypothetical protein